MPLLRAVSGLAPYPWRRGRTKHQEQNIKQLEMKFKVVYNKRDALKEEIMKELVRGEMPSREFRIWLDEGQRIETQFDMLKAQTKGSVLEHLTSVLEYEIVKYLEASPFDHSPCSKAQHKTTSKVPPSGRVKPQARVKKKAGAVREDRKMPFKKPVHDNLVVQLKNKATAEAELKEVNKEMVAKSTLLSSPIKEAAKADSNRVMAKQLQTEVTSKETSSNPNNNTETAFTAEAESKEAKNAITTTEPIATSTSGIQAAQADLDTTAANMATAEPVSMEVKNKSSSPSFLEVEMLQPQPSHSLKAKSHVASSENRYLISPEPRLKTNKSIQRMVC